MPKTLDFSMFLTFEYNRKSVYVCGWWSKRISMTAKGP
jgi:hypothetical protein